MSAGLGRLVIASALVAGAGLSCTDSGDGSTAGGYVEIPGTQVMMDFTRAGSFYEAPWPSEDLRREDGAIDVSGFPNPRNIDFMEVVREAVQEGVDGFGLTSGIFFKLTAELGFDTELNDIFSSSVNAPRRVYLFNVDAALNGLYEFIPVDVEFMADAGPLGDKNLLVLVPLQGIPMKPNTLHAAVVTREIVDLDAAQLGRSAQMTAIMNGRRPEGLSEAAFEDYQSAFNAWLDLESHMGDYLDRGQKRAAPNDLAAMAVFRTGDPSAQMAVARETALANAMPSAPAAFSADEVFDDFCVFSSTIDMPVYQGGEPPFTDGGGAWVYDEAGAPVLQAWETARMVVTVPRAPMPSGGYPTVIMSRTGGGGERPLVDRGRRAENHGPSVEQGEGAGRYFARAGFAGVTVDGPHGGLRNITQGDEQFLMFNVLNPLAMRDNVRQSALELMLTAHVLEELSFAPAGCTEAEAGGGDVTFDTAHLGLMGHSMGATIAPLALAHEPLFGAGLLSGFGGSWIENIVYKQQPLETKPIAETILLYQEYPGVEINRFDPALNLLQWAGESADPPVYGRYIVREPYEDHPARNILMMQGIIDHYIMAPIANAGSLSFGLDLAGPILDEGHPEVTDAGLRSLEPLLQFSHRGAVALPVSGNYTGPDGASITAVVTQHAEDGIEDGHEVVFQTDEPKHQYRCFLQTWVDDGTPTVPDAGGLNGACE